MTFAEMKEKTKIQIVGIVNNINADVSKKNGQTYHSVDLIVSGQKNNINIRLKEDYDRKNFVEGELAMCTVEMSEWNGRTNINCI